jgi:hypothetical protein
MELTPGERKRLMTLRASHQRPPTWAALLPKGIALVVVWCVLVVGFAILVAGAGSPLMYYCLGLVTFLPILALNLIATSVRRWRLNEAITNWDRVEELLAAADRTGV